MMTKRSIYWVFVTAGMILGLLLVGLLVNKPQSISAATTIYNVTDSALVWGGNWAQPTYDPMAIGYYRRYTQNNGDYVQLTFTGTTISYVYMMAYNRGAVEVKLDNNVIDILDSFSRDVQQDLVTPSHRRQVIKTYKTNPGQHTIRLTLRRGDSGSERYFMDLDAFIVDIGYGGYGTYDQTNPYATFFGPWYRWDAADAYNDWFLYSVDPGAGGRFTFEGDNITWYFTRANNRGKAMITIDGGIERYYVDLWSQDTKRNEYVVNSGLGAGIHTIEIVNLGAKRPESTGYFIDVDAFIVYYGPTGNGYNRLKAGNYADSFTHTYNSNYVSYAGYGADCTNFSSQVLLSGGFTNNPNDFLQQVATDHHQWWYNAAWGFYSSETWRITPYFVDYALISNDGISSNRRSSRSSEEGRHYRPGCSRRTRGRWSRW